MFRPTPARLLCAGACVAALAALPTAAQAATTADVNDSVTRGADWAETQQSASTGAFDVFGFDIVPTALAAAGRNAADVSNGGPTSQDSIFGKLAALRYDPSDPSTSGSVEQGILSGYASGIDPARVSSGANVVGELASSYDDGRYGDRTSFNTTVYGALALHRVGAPQFLVDRTVAAIRANQHNDGGWGFTESVTPADQADPSSTDSTGPALAALCESGVSSNDPAVERAIAFVQGTQDDATGGFDPQDGFGTPANADTNGVVVSGLNACGIDPQGPKFQGSTGVTPVDFLLSTQINDGSANDGGFRSGFSGASPDLYATQDAVRALAGAAFSAQPPARSTPTAPRNRAVPTVADGTSVPVSLAVDDGAGGVTFCRVTMPSGATLATLLAAANGGSVPGGCATGGEFTAGQLSRLNGQTGTWAISVSGGAEQVAAGQAVRFGDLVALRRTSGATPAVPGGGPATPVPAAIQAKTTPAAVASKSLKASARKRVVTVAVTCAKANRLCQGSVYLVYRKRTLARRAFLLGGGKTTKLNVKLSKAAIRRVGRSKRIKVNLFSRDGNGIASTSTRTMTLRVTK